MKLKLNFLLLFFMPACSLHALISPPPAVFSHKEHTAFLPQIPKVNVITGDYSENALDLQLAGAEPLSIRRFYSHLGHKNEAYGHWSINPETLMLFDFSVRQDERYAGIGSVDGNFILCESSENHRIVFDPQQHAITHTSCSGQTHPLNMRCDYDKKGRGKHEHYWQGEFRDGRGSKSIFHTEIGKWEKNSNTSHTYQSKIIARHQPNGNIISYTYEDFNEKNKDNPRYKNLETYYILTSIKAHSATGTFLGDLHFKYHDVWKGVKGDKKRYINRIVITGSDKRTLSLNNQIREVERERKRQSATYDPVLKSVDSPGKPSCYYDYRWEGKKTYFDNNYLYSVGHGENAGHSLSTSYDLSSEKVSAQFAPVGMAGAMVPIARYEYADNFTTVYDGENQKTIFRFDKDKRIIATEKYKNNTLIQKEVSIWEKSTGNLKVKRIEDGHGQPLLETSYLYDPQHNVIEERTSDHITYRTFSQNKYNLLLSESTQPGKRIEYSYTPYTNLLESELVYDNNIIVKRTFHSYDKDINSERIRTIIDDGQSTNRNDLSQVTYRKILERKLRKQRPCIGLPEEVLEKTLNAYGDEILLTKVCYTYHPSGKVLQEDHYDATDTYRYSITNKYDQKERLVATTDALGNCTSYSYDDNFNRTSQQGPHKNSHKQWVYDKANRPVEEREKLNSDTYITTKIEYDKCSRITSRTNSCGFETHYIYNPLGQITSIIHPDGGNEYAKYDALGNPLLQRDQNGHETYTTYNSHSQPLTITHPDNSVEQFTYNPHGTIASYIDKHKTKTCYTYDIFDRPTKTTIYSPQGTLLKTSKATYSTFNKLSETNPDNIITFYTYDFAGRLTSKQIGDQIISYEYDPLGNQFKIHQGDQTTTHIYDVKGQLVEKTITSQNQLLFHEAYTYDELGNCTQTKTSQGTSTTVYNALSMPIKHTDPSNNTTTITYSYNGNYTKTTTNAHQVQTIEIHDHCNRIIDYQVKNPSGHLIQRREKIYDPCGNQTHAIEHIFHNTQPHTTVVNRWIYGPCNRTETLIESENKRTRFTYNEAGKLKTTTKPDQTSLHKTYDCLGRLTRQHGDTIDYNYTYDLNDNIITVSTPSGTTTRCYDIYGNLTQETLANNLTLKSTYNSYCQRTHLQLPTDSTIHYTYQGPYLKSTSHNQLTYTITNRDLSGQPTQITLPIGKINISLDPNLRWKTYQAPLFTANYTYDPLGHLTHYQFTDPLGSQSHCYTYDDLNQLTQDSNHSYTYDSLNNRLTKDNHSYSINSLSQITSPNYTYDPCGNLTSDDQITYTYDILDRITTVTKDHQTTTYTYDPFNRRIQKNNDLYLWDGNQEIGCIHNNNLKELRILADNSTAFIYLNNKPHIPIEDHQHNLISLLNLQGIPIETYRYTPFGEPLTNSHLTPWRFASKRHDPETNLIYFGRRYYNPSLGRFITPDPIGFDDGPNLYAYVHNSPLIYSDYKGLFSMSSWESNLSSFFFSPLETISPSLFPYFDPAEVIPIGTPPNSGNCLTYHNGIFTSRDTAITNGEDIILNKHEQEGGYVLYNPSRGLLDLPDCVVNKLGVKQPYTQMCAEFYTDQMESTPDRTFTSYIHSGATTHMANTSKMMKPEHSDRIRVEAFGGATIIPPTAFGDVNNYMSEIDPVPMTNLVRYTQAKKGSFSNVEFLTPNSKRPLKEHSINGATYNDKLNELADTYKGNNYAK